MGGVTFVMNNGSIYKQIDEIYTSVYALGTYPSRSSNMMKIISLLKKTPFSVKESNLV